ncbi:unnamed protein product, partial [Clonostachys rosea f. rosea IK726]
LDAQSFTGDPIKMTATNTNGHSPTVTVLPQTKYLVSLMTVIRDAQTGCPAFVDAFEKVCTQLMPAALELLPTESRDVTTPTGTVFSGLSHSQPICGVSILRAGASMENSLRNSYLGPLSYGKILIQRDEETCLPHYVYCKLPKDIANKKVLILEPMLATGGSAAKAIEVLKDNGVQEPNIIFVNLVASRKGLDVVTKKFPAMQIVTAAVDNDLTASNHIAPGLGDFGDRFYGTTD